jgi:hypothetical protein
MKLTVLILLFDTQQSLFHSFGTQLDNEMIIGPFHTRFKYPLQETIFYFRLFPPREIIDIKDIRG